MRFNLVLIVLLFIMFSPISSTMLHNFIREKNDKRCYCFYYKCVCSRIQLVLLFPCLMLPFSPQSSAGNACLSIPGILGKALTSLQEIHHSHNHQGDESPARGNCSLQEGAVGYEGLLGMFLHPLLREQTRDELPGDTRCPRQWDFLQPRSLGPVSSPRCRVRVIDTFGTEPAYNHEEYATLRGYRTNWGYWNLQPTQFMTMFRKWGTGARWGGSGGSQAPQKQV